MGNIVVISELYYPELTSTGHYMTHIAEVAREVAPVRVICARPNYTSRGIPVKWKEQRKGVRITRCPGTRFDKNNVLLRAMNALSSMVMMSLAAMALIRREDVVLVATNPPVLPFPIALICRWKGARMILRVDDLYPDSAVLAGLLKPTALAVRVMNAMNRRLYRRSDRIVVVGRCMKEKVERKSRIAAGKICVIPNWADVREVSPAAREGNPILTGLGIEGRFVVLMAGNIGRMQQIEFVVDCALALRDEGIHFLFIGAGAQVEWLKARLKDPELRHVSYLPNRPRSEQNLFLNACDVALITLKGGMSGIGVPSRFYNYLAAGKPIIAALDGESETSRSIRENGIGWVVPPGNAEALGKALREAREDPVRLAEMGRKARRVAEESFSESAVLDRYRALFRELGGDAAGTGDTKRA